MSLQMDAAHAVRGTLLQTFVSIGRARHRSALHSRSAPCMCYGKRREIAKQRNTKDSCQTERFDIKALHERVQAAVQKNDGCCEALRRPRRAHPCMRRNFLCAHWEGDTVDSDVKESDRSLLPSQPRGDVKKRFASLYTDNRYADAGE